MLATLVRLVGDLELAQDAVQEAAVVALERWPRDGVPANPAAWLTTVARNKALDRVLREGRRGPKEQGAMRMLDRPDDDALPDSVVRDDLLRLVFTCCHPALAPEVRVALSLRTLGGLSTAEIARAFLVPEATMAQRLVRARRKIAGAAIPYRVPADHELPERLPAVLAVVYLVFTEGHTATSGAALVRAGLCEEAIRLARLLAELLPDEAEVLGLLGLLLVTDARRATRLDATGEIVLLADQDRTLWDHPQINEGARLVEVALRRSAGCPGPYALQAAIAAVHAEAASWPATDWGELVALYDLLVEVLPTPIVRLNRAVAVAERDGPEAGLSVMHALDELHGFHLWHASRAELLRRLGRRREAAEAYRAALACQPGDAERRFLERRAAEVAGSAWATRHPSP
ncbi:MAG: sigma-70 family RNA polymerase sigma factor [Acidimicrobiales bacterium]